MSCRLRVADRGRGSAPPGVGRLSAPRFTLVGQLGALVSGKRGGPAGQASPGRVPLESAAGCWRPDSTSLTSWLPSVVCALFPEPPALPFVTVRRSGWALGLRGCRCARAGTPLGGTAWRVPQGGAPPGGPVPPAPSPVPPPPGDRRRRRAFSQKVIQQTLDRVPKFAYKALCVQSLSSLGSVSHPHTFKSL